MATATRRRTAGRAAEEPADRPAEEPAAPTDPPVDADPEPAPPAGPRRYGPGILALAVVSSLLAGLAAGTWLVGGLFGPDDPPGELSPEAGFARDMITHHAQAVELGLIAYQRASDPLVRQLGYDIATSQQGSIGAMHQWLRDWGVSPNRPVGVAPMAWMPDGDQFAGSPMPGMATPEQIAELQAAGGEDVDRLFLELMITHHLGGVHMVAGVLDLSDHPDVTWLAGLMDTGQRRELEAMRNLLAKFDDATS